eukprot:583993-Amphidinium_carterae.1
METEQPTDNIRDLRKFQLAEGTGEMSLPGNMTDGDVWIFSGNTPRALFEKVDVMEWETGASLFLWLMHGHVFRNFKFPMK